MSLGDMGPAFTIPKTDLQVSIWILADIENYRA